MPEADVREKVQRYITELATGVNIDKDGDYSFRHGSARVFVSVIPQSERTIVQIMAPVVVGAEDTPALYEYVGRKTDDWIFGHLGVSKPGADGKVTVVMRHDLLGDYLDPAEFDDAVAAVAISVDKIDEEVQREVGGSRFH